MADTLTLVPRDGITVANPGVATDGTKMPGAPSTKFALFLADWVDMQRFVAGAVRLPISVGDFRTKYGDFDTADTKDITDCVGAFGKLQAAGVDFGDPVALVKELETLVAGDKPPSLYGQIIWVATHIANTAKTFEFTYKSLKDVLDPAVSRADRVAALKDILTGNGGLRSSAVDMEQQTNALANDLAAFSARLAEARKAVDTYAGQDSKIYKDVKDALAKEEAEIKKTQDLISALAKKYADYVGAAAGGSIGIMILTGGIAWPLAVADAAVFAVLAEETRAAKNAAEALLQQEEVAKAKKVLLSFDLDGLHSQIVSIKTSVDKTANLMADIAGVWRNQVSVFDAIVTLTDIDKLADFSVLQDQIKILDAQDKWHEIAKDTFEYTAHAFVTIQ